MSPAHVFEPTYDRIRRDLVTGIWPYGTRLEAQRIADDLMVSMTPVRDSLNRLVGEGLVEMKPGDGYRVPHLDESGVRDLVDVLEFLLDAALGNREPRSAVALTDQQEDYADHVNAVLASAAGRSGNPSLVGMVRQIGDRLHHLTAIEPLVSVTAEADVAAVARALQADVRELRETVTTYLRHKRASLPEVRRILLEGWA